MAARAPVPSMQDGMTSFARRASASAAARTRWAALEKHLAKRSPASPQPPEVAVAFSGGGVRSAAVSTGVLCFLKEVGLVDNIVSCVSGGGYTGGSFVNWWHHHQKRQDAGEGDIAPEDDDAVAKRQDWMYSWLDRMASGPNPLATCSNFTNTMRDSAVLCLVFAKTLWNLVCTNLPAGFMLAEVLAFFLCGFTFHPTILPLNIKAESWLVLEVLVPIAIVVGLLNIPSLTMISQDNRARFSRIIDALQALLYSLLHVAFSLFMAFLFFATERLPHRDIWALVVTLVAFFVAKIVQDVGGDAAAAVSARVGWAIVYGRIVAHRVSGIDPSHTDHLVAFDEDVWYKICIGCALYGAILYPFQKTDMALSWSNFYRYCLARAYFPPKRHLTLLERIPFFSFMFSPKIPIGYEDPCMVELAASEAKGMPRLITNMTANTWKRQVNVDVARCTTRVDGATTVRRSWDNGKAQIALDSSSYRRNDESCRDLHASRHTHRFANNVGVYHAGASPSGLFTEPAYHTFDRCHTGLALSTAMGVSAAAVSNQMGNSVTDWRELSSIAETGVNWGRWVDVDATQGALDFNMDVLKAAAVAGLIYVPWLIGSFCHNSYFAIPSLLLLVVFLVSSPWHPLWKPMDNFVPSRAVRAEMGQVTYQPAGKHELHESVFMSDGGHSENLALLPILSSRCQRIICIDAGEDEHEQCSALLLLMSQARRFFGCQFAPPAGFKPNYTDVSLYVHDQLLVVKPRAFHLNVVYSDGTRGQLMYLKPRYFRTPMPANEAEIGPTAPPASRTDTCCLPLNISVSNAGLMDHERRVTAAVKACLDSTGTNTGDDTTGVYDLPHVASPAMAQHYRQCHNPELAETPVPDLIGCCCGCCNSRSKCGWTAGWPLKGGRFPQLSTANQFLTVKQRRALHRVGYGCMFEAWQLHRPFFAGAIRARDARRGSIPEGGTTSSTSGAPGLGGAPASSSNGSAPSDAVASAGLRQRRTRTSQT